MKRYIILSLAVAILLFAAFHPVLAQDDRQHDGYQKNKSEYQNQSEKEEHEMKGLGFLHSEDYAYGEYVTFILDMQNNAILNYAINGTPIFDINFDFNFSSNESEGSVTRIMGANGEIIQIHDNPSAIIDIRTKEQSPSINVTFTLASGVTAAKEGNLIRVASGDVVGYIGGSDTTSISITGNDVIAELPADSYAFFRASPVNLPISQDLEKRISQEMEDNNVGAEVTFGMNDTVSKINYSDKMNVSVENMEKDRIRLSLNTTETAGRIIDLNIDNSSLVIGAGEALGIDYDGAPLTCVDSPDIVFNGTDRPLCWISPVQDNKARIIIYIPHYSQHTIDILVEPVATPTETMPAVRTITLDDNGKTITMEVNETFLLKLGEEYHWNISIDNESTISREVNVLVVKGAQGIYRAHIPGQATLTAVGDPVCREAVPPCAMPSRQFTLYVVVASPQTPTPAATPAFEAASLIGVLLALLLLARKRSE